MLVKSREATIVETQVLTVYLKITDNTIQKVADNFSEGAFHLSLTQLDSIYMIEQVVCGI